MKKIYNQFPYMENLGLQHTTPASSINAEMELQRPVNAPYCMSWPRTGWMSQQYLNYIRHAEDVRNSIANRLRKVK